MPEYNSDLYKRYRPTYSKKLYDTVYKFHNKHGNAGYDLALDVGCGTGQTAVDVSAAFRKVVATDYSENMLKEAFKKENITYKVASAENLSEITEPKSVDLIVCSTAAHWFNMPLFYKECQKILKPTGTLAIWAYLDLEFPNYPQLTKAYADYSNKFLGGYFAPGKEYLEHAYTHPNFMNSPFKDFDYKIHPKDSNELLMRSNWTIEELKGYTWFDSRFLLTWSAYKTWKEKHPTDKDPVDKFISLVCDQTGQKDLNTNLEIVWPIVMILAKNQ
ncbi:hypothetical protein HDV01_002151 [Terramyces sp. JEL0728]|nr:hypothetical protein HDV01_002151 [Terramyces sp. JEL0728]